MEAVEGGSLSAPEPGPAPAAPAAGATGPGSVGEFFARLQLERRHGDLGELLKQVQPRSHVIEDFRPVCAGLEWSLGHSFWQSRGVNPFVRNEVPFLINNDGLASESAAAVLFANCRAAARLPERLQVLELGAGIGLFARFFLDAFRALCEQEGMDFYQRLTYFVTDESARSVENWQRVGLFADHAAHVVLGICNASAPQRVTSLSAESHDLTRIRALLCNYVLDVLPACAIKREANHIQELCVRTHLSSDAALVAQYTALSPARVTALAASDDAASRERLIPLLTLFEPELDYRPITRDIPGLAAALEVAEEQPRFLFNHGAVHCLEQCLPLLDAEGFVLLNDYGHVGGAPAAAALPQRFGASSANGINFPLFEKLLARCGYCISKPAGDDELAIHTRLLSVQSLPATEEVFASRFGKEASSYFTLAIEAARAHAAAGRKQEALESYKVALGRQARNWSLIGEAAEFTAMHLRDYAAGLQLCAAALELNPCYSSWLWNVMGDCLYCMNRYAEAHEAYLQAAAIDARDPRTQLNLAYTYHLRGDFDAALAAIAQGFAADGTAVYRDRLYERLQQTLAAISGRTQGERERLLARQARSL